MLSLSCAIGEYEHVRALETGRVKVEGASLNFVRLPVEEIFFRAIRFNEFDLSEMSMGRYVAMVSEGTSSYSAIPVFPSRMFRHSAIYVRTNGPINEPRDLCGARVGIPEWAQTAGIYVRGLLADIFDVDLNSIDWVQGGLQQVGREEEVILHLPKGIRIRKAGKRTLNEMLLSGELDALISAHPPDSFKQRHPSVRRLFGNVNEEEKAYWKMTGIFPIMHTIVVKTELLGPNSWIATNLQKAFEESKNHSLARAREMTASRFPFPFFQQFVHDIGKEFGEDFWPYGVEANRKTLQTFLEYAYRQGVTQRQLTIRDLFPPNVMAHFKI